MFHTFTSWHHEPLNETRRIISSKIYEFSLVLFPLICSYVVVFYLSNLWNLTFSKQIKEFVWQSFHLHLDVWLSGIISCMRQANERRCYIVMLSFIGRTHTWIDPSAMGYVEPWVFTDKIGYGICRALSFHGQNVTLTPFSFASFPFRHMTKRSCNDASKNLSSTGNLAKQASDIHQLQDTPPHPDDVFLTHNYETKTYLC